MHITISQSTNYLPKQSELDRLRSGSEILYIFGKITHWDVFGRPHGSKFCMSYEPPALTLARTLDTYNAPIRWAGVLWMAQTMHSISAPQ